jgi:DNA-binding PadR family transcriptional regulator
VAPLSTTAYAVLGLLAVRPWTTYELAQNLRRNFHFFFARTESGIYEEPKRLARLGLVTAKRDHVGARARTTYSITRKGRAALRAWLATPCAPPRLDAEALVRVWFARAGEPRDLESAFAGMRALAEEIQSIGRVVAREFRAGTAPYQSQPHLNAIVFDFLWTWADHMRGWAHRWQTEVLAWRDAEVDDRKLASAMAAFMRADEPRSAAISPAASKRGRRATRGNR